MSRFKIISVVIGGTAIVGLFLFYILTMKILAGSWDAVWWQFRQLWYLMLPLMVGFGIQAGLFVYLKYSARRRVSNKILAGNSSVSVIGMAACCAHHLTDVVPILGLSALSVWLTAYQRPLLIIGILSNFAGIIHMWKAKNQLRQLDKQLVV
jgi:hypothetical protein